MREIRTKAEILKIDGIFSESQMEKGFILVYEPKRGNEKGNRKAKSEGGGGFFFFTETIELANRVSFLRRTVVNFRPGRFERKKGF